MVLNMQLLLLKSSVTHIMYVAVEHHCPVLKGVPVERGAPWFRIFSDIYL